MRKIIFVWLFAFIVYFSRKTFVTAPESFFNISAASLVTFLISVYVAYYLVQEKNDERSRKLKAEKIIERIQEIVNEDDSKMYTSEINAEQVLQRYRRLKNKTQILSKYCKKLDLDEEASYLQNQVERYSQLLDYHYGDHLYLKEHESELKSYLKNIDQKCDDLSFCLYYRPNGVKKYIKKYLKTFFD